MNSLRAVVVDDNHLNRELVVRTLESKGIKTVQAEDATKGWKVIQMTAPQLLVLDIMLPGVMDGVSLCRLVRSDPRFQNAVIVMVTAADKRREAERSLAAGADILLPKPFSPREFWVQVEALLKQKIPAPKSYRVFVLEDDEKECLLIERVLTTAGYQVMTQTSSPGAIASIKSFRPDLILLDVMMPGLSGDEMAKIINRDKAFNYKPKLLYYSNKSAAELAALARETGVEGYVCKTEGPTALLQAVQRLLTPS